MEEMEAILNKSKLEDFIIQYKSEITRIVEVTAAFTGLLFYKKYKYTNAKSFIYFLVYLSIGDFINTYVYYIRNEGLFNFLEGTVFERNHWWSTSFWKVGAIMFFAFYYYKILKTKPFRAIIKFSGYAFFGFSVVYIFLNWDDFFIRFFPIISILGAVVIFLCTVFYFIEILRSDNLLNFYRSLNFYISVAIFIWWLIITPLVFYDIYSSAGDWNFIFLRWQIYLLANIFMYSTFTFALIFCKPEND